MLALHVKFLKFEYQHLLDCCGNDTNTHTQVAKSCRRSTHLLTSSVENIKMNKIRFEIREGAIICINLFL